MAIERRTRLERMTNDFDDLLEANRAYAATFDHGDLQAPAQRELAVVTCVDSRINPYDILGLAPGDAKVIRTAGARITDDVLRSLVITTSFLNVTRIMVMIHTDCAAASASDDEFRQRLASERPELAAEAAQFDFAAEPDQMAALRSDLGKIVSHPLIADDVAIGACEYDVASGMVRPLSVGASA